MSSNNTIIGRVVLKETGVGIPDLLVVLHDIDPGTRPEEIIGGGDTRRAAASASLGIGDRIGSRLTDQGGAFEFAYDDDEFRIRNADEKRPDLRLSVIAPEEPGIAPDTRVLYTSADVRQNAGRTEHYLIRLPSALLQKFGLPLPLDPALAKDQAQTVIGRMGQAISHQRQIDRETRKLASDQVASMRKRAQQTEAAVETRLIEALTGVNAADADRLNMVMPGAKPETTVWKTVNKNIENTINNKPPLSGYIVISDAQANAFRDTNGSLRQGVPAAEIEPFLYRADRNSARPSFLLRTDPAVAACRASSTSSSLEDPGDGSSSPGGSAPSMQPNDTPLTKEALPAFLGNLVNNVSAPEVASIFAPKSRPNADDVQNAVQSLQLRAGPADVPAFYDFHQLQIAFDYVWQQAIDEGVLATSKALCRELIERGGDPVTAINSHIDPFKGLRNEADHVFAAQNVLQTAGLQTAGLQTTGISMRIPSDPVTPGTSVGTNPTMPPPPPPLPPVVKPPFFDIVAGVPTHFFESIGPHYPHALLNDLENMLSERYKFEVFAPGSTNFGLLVTYRQRWQRIAYQVGDLVKTLTLAPKETRKVSSKRVIKKERSVKEMEENLRVRKDEINDAMRDEAEIVQKAQDKTNFNVTGKGSYNIGISKGDSTTSFTRDAESSSSDVKKSFREAVLKAAQEYKDERKLEVDTKETFEEETIDTAEITNPNDELTVTYLFYELQSRHQVSESIHKLTPVVLVAMEVPNPNRTAIDRVLLAHSWIINRVLLDDRYRPALDFLSKRIVGDELALRELAANVAKVRQIVDDQKRMHREMLALIRVREDALQRAIEDRAAKVSGENTEGIGEKAWEWVVGSGDGEDLEAARIREDMIKDDYERAVREEKELRMRLDAETAALNAATEGYAKAQAAHANHLLEIAGLRLHFKENVLYYMQAIWSFTFQDQIFFSLCNTKVPRLTATSKTYDLAEPTQPPLGVVHRPGQVVLEVRAEVKLASDLQPDNDFVTLAEIADLDKPLGFKGNYMIFPMKQSNALTDFMMVPYVDSELGLRDPDDLGSWTPEDFAKYARCLLRKLRGELGENEFAVLQARLANQYTRIVSNPRMANDEVIVPTRSLYIEALPGTHPLLEDFKLAHRIIDVKRAQAETRKLEMENLRYAARILNDELEDPEIDKKVVVQGGSVIIEPDS